MEVEHIKKLKDFAQEHNFSLPPGFESKTLEELADCYNGIGAEWMPAKVRKWVTKFFAKLEAASMFHDFEFMSINKSYWNFTKANFRLFFNGCKSKRPFSGLFLAVVCQIFGWTAWKEGKETMAYCYYLGGE